MQRRKGCIDYMAVWKNAPDKSKAEMGYVVDRGCPYGSCPHLQVPTGTAAVHRPSRIAAVHTDPEPHLQERLEAGT